MEQQYCPGNALSPTIELRVGFYCRCAGLVCRTSTSRHAQSIPGIRSPYFDPQWGALTYSN